MITKADSLPSQFQDEITFARVRAVYNTYGENIWIQKIGGRVTALIGRTGGGFSLCAQSDADFAELDSYFAFFGAEVFCSGKIAQNLTPESTKVFGLYEYKGIGAPSGHGKISDIYPVLCDGTDGDIVLLPFDMWYTDFCARYNHFAAEYALLGSAAAVCGFMTDKISLITGVAVKKDCRGRQLGRKAVAALVGNIRQKYKDSRILAAASEAAGFYVKCGFAPAGTCAVCKYQGDT